MESNQSKTDNSQDIVNENQNFVPSKNNNYLYQNGHRITHQTRWFKGCRDRGFKYDVAAWIRH